MFPFDGGAYDALPETNIPKKTPRYNNPLEKEVCIGNHPFLGAMFVLGNVLFSIWVESTN